MSWLIGFLLLFAAMFVVAPAIVVLALPVPASAKRGALVSVLDAAWRELLRLPFNVTAPFAVPILIACRQLKWEHEFVGGTEGFLNLLWGNNIRHERDDGTVVGGINGDVFQWELTESGRWQPLRVPLEDTPEVRAINTWAPGHHPRSNYSRFQFIGLRNRAANLAKVLGKQPFPGAAYEEAYGNTNADDEKQGWFAVRVGRAWQIRGYKPLLGGRLLWKFNVGFKLHNMVRLQEAAHASNFVFGLRRA